MANELQDLKQILASIQERMQAKKYFDILLVHKKVDDDDTLIPIRQKEIRKIRLALLGEGIGGSFTEKKATKDISEHIEDGDKISVNLKAGGTQFYIVHPVEFTTMVNNQDNVFNFVLKSFKILQARS